MIYSPTVLGWFNAHAINPATASACGVTEAEGVLRFKITPREGEPFIRSRRLPGHCLQPKGKPLAPWWPKGYRQTPYALIVEGEGDALAAESSKGEPLSALAVVALPGAGVAHESLTKDLTFAGVRSAALALDADEAGRKATAKLADRLTRAGLACLIVELPDGCDLSDVLARSPDPMACLSEAVGKARIFTQPTTPAGPKTPRSVRYSAPVFKQSGEITAALDNLRTIPAAEYLEPVAGVEPLPGGRVRCPLPDHDDRNPSASYRDCFWFCHCCGTGGDLFALVAAITGRSTTGPDFLDVARWAAERLTNNPAVFMPPERRS